jgi:putative transposase
MPDHVHLLITVHGDMTVERAMQFVKSGFSYRLRKEIGYTGDVWQRGFSEVRVDNRESFLQHREYIAQSPVKAGLVDSRRGSPIAMPTSQGGKRQGLKPSSFCILAARLKAVP